MRELLNTLQKRHITAKSGTPCLPASIPFVTPQIPSSMTHAMKQLDTHSSNTLKSDGVIFSKAVFQLNGSTSCSKNTK